MLMMVAMAFLLFPAVHAVRDLGMPPARSGNAAVCRPGAMCRVAAALRLQEADWATPGTCFPQYAYAEDPDGDHFFAPPSPLVSELGKVIEQGLARGEGGDAGASGELGGVGRLCPCSPG